LLLLFAGQLHASSTSHQKVKLQKNAHKDIHLWLMAVSSFSTPIPIRGVIEFVVGISLQLSRTHPKAACAVATVPIVSGKSLKGSNRRYFEGRKRAFTKWDTTTLAIHHTCLVYEKISTGGTVSSKLEQPADGIGGDPVPHAV
jgi:hypothetical protein